MKIERDVSDSVLYLGKPTRIKCYNCNNEGHKAIDCRNQDSGFCSVTRKVILPKTVEPNNMTTKKTVTKVIVGFAHGVNEMATWCKTVSRITKPQEVSSIFAIVEKGLKRRIIMLARQLRKLIF